MIALLIVSVLASCVLFFFIGLWYGFVANNTNARLQLQVCEKMIEELIWQRAEADRKLERSRERGL